MDLEKEFGACFEYAERINNLTSKQSLITPELLIEALDLSEQISGNKELILKNMHSVLWVLEIACKRAIKGS